MCEVSQLEDELVSIIIPVYQVENYLKRCLDSVINQTYKNIEIILVDDGSMDLSGDICDEYALKDSRIRVLHKKNGGLSSARNAGLDLMQGEYVSFVDSDDWITVDYIEHLYQILKRNNADFSMAHMKRTTKYKEETNSFPCVEKEKVLSRDDFLKILFKVGTQENVQYAWAKLYKRDIFEKIRFPVGLTAEDVPTTFQIALASKKIVYSKKVIYNYYFNPESITGKTWSSSAFDLLKIWDLVCEKAEENGENDIIQYAKLNRMRADFGVLCLIAKGMPRTELMNNKKKVKEIQRQLRMNAKELLSSWIPLSRKVMIVGFCVSYPMCIFLIRAFIRIKQ